MMTNGFILHDNLILDAGVALSGGAWALPVSNLADPRMIARPARCTAIANAQNSRVEIDLGAAKAVQVLLVCHHTMSLAATYSLRASSTSGHTGDLYNQPGELVIGSILPSLALPWEEPSFWTGQPRVKDIAGYARHLLITLPAGVVARYWRLDFADTANPAGQIDLGYLMMGEPIAVEWNFDLGRTLSKRFRSIVDETPGGSEIVDRRLVARRQQVTWSYLSEDEAMRLYDMVINRQAVDPVAFVPDPDGLVHQFRNVYPAKIVGGGEPRRSDRRHWSISVELEEILA